VCVDLCPEVFELDDESIAVVKVEPVPSDEETSCQEAADGCPTEAIEIED
jgi:ferredoxin